LPQKNLTNDFSTKNESLGIQQSIDKQDANLPANAKKQISGIWPLIIFLGLLALIFILGLLTT
jgi:hypothetical protein